MSEYIDLTHEFRDGMPGFRMKNEDGSHTEFTATIEPFLTHEQTEPKYDGQASFEISEMHFQTSMGTYLDAPAHRFPGGRDIADLTLEELIADGVVIDARGYEPHEPVDETVLPDDIDLSGKAVLINFGWDSHWGTDQYREYPYISESLVNQLIDEEVSLVGVDTINIDSDQNPKRPAHTQLLEQEILVIENLCGLDTLHDYQFRFYAMPLKAVDTVAMPIRAFAETTS